LVVTRDGHDDSTVCGWPHDEHPIVTVEVAAADVVEHLAG
jgi:hypothetical protein